MMTETLSLFVADECTARRSTIDRALEAYLPRAPHCPSRLAEAMHYAVFPGGKRLRPVLTLFAAAACECDESSAIAPACAVELVHCYSLVHDDLPAMDDDDLRRGRATVHKAFDEATAILAGDALLTLAFQLIAEHVYESDLAAACTRELAAAAGPLGMVGGQADDMAGATGARTAAQRLRRLRSIHARKTGALFSAAIRLGAIVARASRPARNALDHFADRIGLAFQITDDLLDLCGDETKLGKRARKDAEHGKLTFPSLMGAQEAAREADLLIEDACSALLPLGTAATPLCELARFVMQRDH